MIVNKLIPLLKVWPTTSCRMAWWSFSMQLSRWTFNYGRGRAGNSQPKLSEQEYR